MHNPFRYFNSSPEVIRLAVMLYIRYPLSLRQVEDLLFERGIDICHETVRFVVEPLHALRRSVKYLRPGQRDISVAVNPCVVVPRDTLIHHRACAAASSNAGCVST